MGAALTILLVQRKPLICEKGERTVVAVQHYSMPLFHFTIGDRDVRIGPQFIAEQFCKSPESFGHRLSPEEAEALCDSDFLRKIRDAAETVNGRCMVAGSSMRTVFATIHRNPWHNGQ